MPNLAKGREHLWCGGGGSPKSWSHFSSAHDIVSRSLAVDNRLCSCPRANSCLCCSHVSDIVAFCKFSFPDPKNLETKQVTIWAAANTKSCGTNGDTKGDLQSRISLTNGLLPQMYGVHSLFHGISFGSWGSLGRNECGAKWLDIPFTNRPFGQCVPFKVGLLAV